MQALSVELSIAKKTYQDNPIKKRISNSEHSYSLLIITRGKTFIRMNFHDPNGFSHGGNVWQLINSFREFIITGKCGDLRDYKEIWAYSYEGCMKIRNKGKEIGFVESIVYPYSY